MLFWGRSELDFVAVDDVEAGGKTVGGCGSIHVVTDPETGHGVDIGQMGRVGGCVDRFYAGGYRACVYFSEVFPAGSRLVFRYVGLRFDIERCGLLGGVERVVFHSGRYILCTPYFGHGTFTPESKAFDGESRGC